MSKSLLAFLLIFPCTSFTQTFSIQNDWFDNYGFIESQFILSRKIKSISITIRKKDDGKYFENEKALLQYHYNQNGLLDNSYKFIELRNKIDTAIFSFNYDHKNRVVKRVEQQGPFHFSYYFHYSNNYLDKEIKIDERTRDTAYIRFYHTSIQGTEKRITLLNAVKKPFSFVTEKRSKKGLLLSTISSYLRNKNTIEKIYSYDNNMLIEKKSKKLNQENYISSTYSYKDEKLEQIRIKRGDQLIKKLAFTYNEKGLPKEIIERDLIEMSIKIYSLSYSLYY